MDKTLNPPIPSHHNITAPVGGRSYLKESFTTFFENPIASKACFFLVFIILASIIIPFFSPYSFFETHLANKNSSPTLTHWFGTDELGRDIFTRLWWGGRVSLLIGFAAGILDVSIGVVYGCIAGFFGNKLDELLMRIVDILSSLPSLLIVILLVVIIEPGLFTIILSLAFTGWVTMARIVRTSVLQLKELDFVKMAVMIGASKKRIIFKHLVPNMLGSIITTATLSVPSAIFGEAFLSFLGLGVQAPLASWGSMASDGLTALVFYPWRIFFPALFISLTMLAFNLIGDGIRDAFDPKVKS
ncbi:diguanylate cyclase [Candidatus Aerophobetes bacterium]|uniref:Diguanylate cyclase n=1 Tax=Aerophobetes bacterium TaxID=2030807 RepID=A0A2A4WZH0_UNCAE|nr:MAG: diguanylate cyclase [Candidatus Aerophobetes bacterium]